MAKKTETVPVTVSVPKGFTNQTRRQADGWAKVEAGLIIHGKKVGDFQRDDDGEVQRTVLLELKAPCKAVDSDKQEVTLEPGQVVGVDVKGAIRDLFNYANGTEVFLIYKGKISIKGGRQTMWDIEMHTQGEPKMKARVAGPEVDGPLTF